MGYCGLKLKAPPVFGTTGAIKFTVLRYGPFKSCFIFSELEGVWPVSGVQCKVCACLTKCDLHKEVRLRYACE